MTNFHPQILKIITSDILCPLCEVKLEESFSGFSCDNNLCPNIVKIRQSRSPGVFDTVYLYFNYFTTRNLELKVVFPNMLEITPNLGKKIVVNDPLDFNSLDELLDKVKMYLAFS